ncbi:TlpA family protein disulfide reductase [Azohydromonas caseinilytica]|uniref:TlpA family protein disulfide reductase n=1 Tax=Azohydromonas caseinilytica TaxID=2728836 RepID=A0A848F541_9BURK|nr:TlpA disulfide reductase family protein [Azohydromonas caseinilytica]NML15167.1 TlpA family protein disulfide reductase [Azohydromonas caseinilytica]
MKRRLWLTTAAVAAAGGAGLAWWRSQPRGTPAPAALWALELERPQGGRLALATLRGQPLLLNFWATWCPPCVKEMPELDRFSRDFAARGGRVLGVAIDGPAPVREFLQQRPVGYDIALGGLAGTDLMRQLGNQAGVLPFTVLLDAAGHLHQSHAGETTREELLRWAESLG